MPGGDGTGPLGRGALSGRGLGYCSGYYPSRYGFGRRLGLGLGYGRGFRRFYPAEPLEPKLSRDLLEEEREMLQERLNYLNKQLDSRSEEKDK